MPLPLDDPNHPGHWVRQQIKDFNDHYDKYFGQERCKRYESNRQKLAKLRSELTQANASFDDLERDLEDAQHETQRLRIQLGKVDKSLKDKEKELQTQKKDLAKKDADLKKADQEHASLKNQLNRARND